MAKPRSFKKALHAATERTEYHFLSFSLPLSLPLSLFLSLFLFLSLSLSLYLPMSDGIRYGIPNYRVTQHYLAIFFQSRFLNKLIRLVLHLKSSFFPFFDLIVLSNIIDNRVVCIIQVSNYVMSMNYNQSALIWFQSQLSSSNRLEMA